MTILDCQGTILLLPKVPKERKLASQMGAGWSFKKRLAFGNSSYNDTPYYFSTERHTAALAYRLPLWKPRIQAAPSGIAGSNHSDSPSRYASSQTTRTTWLRNGFRVCSPNKTMGDGSRTPHVLLGFGEKKKEPLNSMKRWFCQHHPVETELEISMFNPVPEQKVDQSCSGMWRFPEMGDTSYTSIAGWSIRESLWKSEILCRS